MHTYIHLHSTDPSISHMAFGYETSHNTMKNDYTKHSLVMHHKQADKLCHWKYQYIVIIMLYL